MASPHGMVEDVKGCGLGRSDSKSCTACCGIFPVRAAPTQEGGCALDLRARLLLCNRVIQGWYTTLRVLLSFFKYRNSYSGDHNCQTWSTPWFVELIRLRSQSLTLTRNATASSSVITIPHQEIHFKKTTHTHKNTFGFIKITQLLKIFYFLLLIYMVDSNVMKSAVARWILYTIGTKHKKTVRTEEQMAKLDKSINEHDRGSWRHVNKNLYKHDTHSLYFHWDDRLTALNAHANTWIPMNKHCETCTTLFFKNKSNLKKRKKKEKKEVLTTAATFLLTFTGV